MRPNGLKEKWRKGEAATNAWLSLGNPITAEMMAHHGWDSLTVDMQHGQADHAGMVAMLTALSTTDTVPLVRVPWNEPGQVMRTLDAGAYGIICPNIDTRADCERFVGACRYSPKGYRSVGAKRAMLYAGNDYMAHANETLLTIVQIESADGVRNAAEIASVPGLDMLYVGPSDLGLSLGREARVDQTDAIVVKTIDEILAAAKKAGLRAGIYCASPDYARSMIAKGFDLVTVTSDQALIETGRATLARMKS